jgi:hypothetical protein
MPIEMTTTAAYRTWVALFRRLKFSALAIALLGGLIGLVTHGSARVVIWIVSGLLTIWLGLAGAIEQARYQRILDRTEYGQTSDLASISLGMTTPMGSPGNADQRDRSPDPSRTETLRPSGSENEVWRLLAVQRYQHFFLGVAFVGLGITIAGVAISLFVSGGVRAAVIGGLVVGGLWISTVSLVLRKRIRTGPQSNRRAS